MNAETRNAHQPWRVTASSGGTGAVGACGSATAPTGTPPDWERYSGYCDCPIYVPGAKGALPAPVEWEPCPTPGPDNPTCRRMKTPWTKTKNLSLGAYSRMWIDPATKKAYLMLSRVFVDDSDQRYDIIAEPDGDVANAFFQGNGYAATCSLYTQSFVDGRYAYSVIPTAAPAPGQVEALLAGAIGALPSVVLSNPVVGESHTGWEVSSSWLVRVKDGKFWARAWGSTDELLVESPSLDPEGQSAYIRRASGQALFWEVGGLTYHGVMGWTVADGARPIARYPGDYTQGAGNFATDGVDMVWTHGEGKAPSDKSYPTRSIVTAPFSTDPVVIQQKQKRLRSDPGQLSAFPYAIGCGHAARVIYPATDAGVPTSSELFVVRLSDGVAWTVVGPALSTDVLFMDAVGFTCEEVFAAVQFPDDASTIVRIRLDSLGPGSPPD